MNVTTLKVNDSDNVAVAITELKSGDVVSIEGKKIALQNDIPAGHKFALTSFEKGDEVIKYGFRIGVAKAEIAVGEWVHEHNVKTALSGQFDAKPDLVEMPKTNYPNLENLTFNGYRRKNGDVAIRNEIWIVPTVGCVNGAAREMAKRFNEELKFDSAIDGCYAFEHPFGCSQLGGDHETTQKFLAGLVNHPNAAGVLVLGLGCENNQVSEFKKMLGEIDEERVRFLISQEVDDEDAVADLILNDLTALAREERREQISVSELKVGLKCGGSDAFSGLSANPLVGVFSEMLIQAGGAVGLTEIPEIFGAENEFLPRSANREICDRATKLINDFRDYFIAHGEPVSENPSPGNRKGGITTLEEKSLGCVQKGGRVNIVDVLDFGEPITKKGLSLLNGPGNDLVAVSNLAASGVHLTLFTTGRGTPAGSPVPVLKIGTNSDLASRKRNWIDFNAGIVLQGTSMESSAMDLFDLIIKTANGEKTKSEQNEYRDFAIFKRGVTL